MYDQQNAGYYRLMLTAVILLLYTLPATSRGIYHWVDDLGQIHYEDRAVTGAKKVELKVSVPATNDNDEKPAMNAFSPPEKDKVLTAEGLADCLRHKGVKFYTASWCPQCAKQRRLFGSHEDSLPTVECAVNGTRKQTGTCKTAGITAYPTWVFADGSRYSGVKSLATLAHHSGCDVY